MRETRLNIRIPEYYYFPFIIQLSLLARVILTKNTKKSLTKLKALIITIN